MPVENIFNSMDYLEPRCPECKVVLKYGQNTKFNDEKQKHICNKCGTEVE